MKPLLLLAALALSAPALRAQEMTTPAQIDPAARDLLARTMARYQKFNSFESVIFWRIGPAGQGLNDRRFRVQMKIIGQFVAGEEFPDKSWRKWISDGKTVVGFSSKFPGRYTRASVKSPLYLGLAPQLEASLRSVGIEGPLLSMMLSDDLSADVMSPNLRALDIENKGELKVVALRAEFPSNAGTTEMGALELSIDPQTLALDHVTTRDGGGEVFTESYAQTRFNPTFDANMFRAAAPVGYKLIESFEPGSEIVIAKPPQIAVIR